MRKYGNNKLFIIGGIVVCITAILLWMNYFSHSSKKIQSDLVSYNRDIRPILSDKCFTCHGPDVKKVKAELRLDQAAFAFAELKKTKGHYAIIPGDPDHSEIIVRMESTDPKIMMPLPESHLTRLTPEEIALFKKWIKHMKNIGLL
jgi:hypothetical protein